MAIRLSSSKPVFLAIAVIATCISPCSHALWLNTYGTGANELSAKQIIRLNGGSYAVSGEILLNNETNNWYGRLDEDGKLLWSKATGNVLVTMQSNGSVHLQAKQKADNDYVTINATGNVDLATGVINDIRIDNNNVVTGNNGELYSTGLDGIYAGTWTADATNKDVVLAKVNADNQVVWSRRYDFSVADDMPAIYPLKNGYLLTMGIYGFNPTTYAADWLNVLAKLDANGNYLAGSARQLTSGFGFYPTLLSDGGILLSNHGFGGDISLYKLDSKLNFVWGKRYFSLDEHDSLTNFNVAEGSDAQIEVHANRQHRDADSQLLEEHALALLIDANNGNLLSKTEVKLRNFDPNPFKSSALGQYRLYGNAGDVSLELEQNQDGLFAVFNNTFQPEWAKLLAGPQQDQVEIFDKASGGGLYLLGGNTKSWGAGNTDLLFAKLDQQGSITGCQAIQELNAMVSEANIVWQNLTNPMSNATVLDGVVPIAVTRQELNLAFNPVDYPLTVTTICTAADPVITPSSAPTATTKQIAKATDAQITEPTPVAVLEMPGAQAADYSAPAKPTSTTVSDIAVPAPITTKLTNPPVAPITPLVSDIADLVDQPPAAPVTPKSAPVSTIELSATQLDFGSIAVQTSATKDIIINNAGEADLTITATSDTGTGFSKDNDECRNKAISAGGNCKISFRFAPVKAGQHSVQITINSTAANNSHVTLTLQGTATNPSSVKNAELSVSDIGLGGRITITGSGYGKQKGKVLIGAKAAAILSWADTRIIFKVPSIKAGSYSLAISSKNKVIDNSIPLRVHAPEIHTISPIIADKTAKVTLYGQYFGVLSKPKVTLLSGKLRKEAGVVAGNTDTTLTIKLPKLKPAAYQLHISNNAGEGIAQTSFLVP